MDFQEWQVTIVTGLFILFIVWDISWDIAKQHIKGVTWIPGKALVLSALTVQLVGYFDRKNIDIFGKSREQQVKQLIDNQLFIDGARLCFCVFLGYIQPEMASAKSGGRWSNVAALVLSLSLHVGTEIFALENGAEARKLKNEEFNVSSNVVFLVGATCLVIYLGLTILAGKYIRDSLSEKMSRILSENRPQGNKLSSIREKISQILLENLPEGDKLCSFREKISQIFSENLMEDDRSSRFKLEMLKSWTVAFAWKAQYKLASSAFVPAVGMIVTICVAMVGNKARRLLHHGSDLGLASCLQCVFIIIGWIWILCRWFIDVSFYGDSTDRKLNDVFHCANRFTNLLFLYMQIELNPRQLIIKSYLKRKPSTIFWATVAVLTWTIFFIVLIPLFIFIVVVHLLFIISYLSWVFSSIMADLGNATGLPNLLKKMIGGQESTAATKEDDEFVKCKEYLQQMFQGVQIGEDIDRLWKYHLKSYNQRKPRMKEAYQEIQECQELFKVFTVGENSGSSLKELQNSNQPLKMVAVAIIDIMVRLLTKFGRDLKMDVGVEDIIKAYKEIKDLLEFVDCPENIAIDPMDMFGTCNLEAFETSLEADKYIRLIEKQIEQRPRGDAQQTPKRQPLLDILKDEKKELEEETEKSERKSEGDFRYPGIIPIVAPFIFSFFAFRDVVKRVEKLLEPVNKSLNGVDGCRGSVVKCLCYVIKRLGYLLLFCMIVILSLLLAPIIMGCLLLQMGDMDIYGYNKDRVLKKSRHFIYIPILDSYISQLEKYNDDSKDGKVVITCLGNEMIGCFRELIYCCVQQLPDLLIKHSNKWAEEFQQDKISKALEIAEKLRALMEMSKTGEINVNEVDKRAENERGVENEIQIDVMDSK